MAAAPSSAGATNCSYGIGSPAGPITLPTSTPKPTRVASRQNTGSSRPDRTITQCLRVTNAERSITLFAWPAYRPGGRTRIVNVGAALAAMSVHQPSREAARGQRDPGQQQSEQVGEVAEERQHVESAERDAASQLRAVPQRGDPGQPAHPERNRIDREE